MMAITLTCAAATIRVDVSGSGDYLSIGEGIAAADVGDTVLVAPGTYTGPLNRGITIPSGGVWLTANRIIDLQCLYP